MEEGKIKNKKVRFLVNIAFWAVILALVYVLLKYCINQVLPLVIGFILAAIARPISKWMSAETKKVRAKDGTVTEAPRKVKLPKKLSAVLSVVLILLVLAGLICLFVFRIVDTVVDWVSLLPGYYESTLLPAFYRAADWVVAQFSQLDQEYVDAIRTAALNLVSSVGSLVTNFSGKAVKWAATLATKLPSALLNSIIAVIATIFFSTDFDSMKNFFKRLLPEKALSMVVKVKDSFLDMIWQFLRSYALIFVITVAEILVGLLLCGIKKPFLIALLIGIFDAFPIVGSGLILLPWGIITMITGSVGRGIGILIVWAVVVVARQILEPKIVGTRVGLRPLVTLVCMYVGNKLLGIWGLFGLPITAAIVTDLERNGYIRLFSDEREEEPETQEEPDLPAETA